MLGFFRTTIELTDTSLLEEWESMLHPELLLRKREEREKAVEAIWVRELVENPKVFAARVRSEMHLFVQALANRNWEEAAEKIVHEPAAAGGEMPADDWDAGRLEAALRAVLRGVHRPHHLAREPPSPLDADPSDRRPSVGGAADPDGPTARQLLGHPRPCRPAPRHLGRGAVAQDRNDLEVGRPRRRKSANGLATPWS